MITLYFNLGDYRCEVELNTNRLYNLSEFNTYVAKEIGECRNEKGIDGNVKSMLYQMRFGADYKESLARLFPQAVKENVIYLGPSGGLSIEGDAAIDLYMALFGNNKHCQFWTYKYEQRDTLSGFSLLHYPKPTLTGADVDMVFVNAEEDMEDSNECIWRLQVVSIYQPWIDSFYLQHLPSMKEEREKKFLADAEFKRKAAEIKREKELLELQRRKQWYIKDALENQNKADQVQAKIDKLLNTPPKS